MKLTRRFDNNSVHAVHPGFISGSKYATTYHNRGYAIENSLIWEGSLSDVTCPKCLSSYHRFQMYLGLYKHYDIYTLAEFWYKVNFSEPEQPGLKFALMYLIHEKTKISYRKIRNRLNKDYRIGHISDFECVDD